MTEELKYEAKFGDWIQQGFNLFKDNMGLLIPASILAFVVSILSVGILAGPMMAGMTAIVLALIDKKEPKPQAGDMFKGFQWFLPSFLFVLVWCVVPHVLLMAIHRIPFLGMCAGPLLGLGLTFGLMPLLMFAVFLIVDRKMDFWPASMASIDMVKDHFLPLLGLYVISAIIGAIGIVACFIGIVVTASITPCILAVAYREITAVKESPATPIAPTPTPPQSSPPPAPPAPPAQA